MRRGRAGTHTWPARVVAGLLALFWALPWFGLIDLLVVVLRDEEFRTHYLMESGWGLLYLVLVAGPLAVLCLRPGRRVAIDQVWVCALAILAGGVWGYAWPQLVTGLGVAASAGLIEWLGGAPRPRWTGVDPVMAVLALLALAAAVAYGDPLARNTTGTEDVTNAVSHFPMQASVALAVAGVALLAAARRSRLPLWSAAFCAAWLGLESVVYPDLVGSLGVLGGWAAVAWAVVLGLVGERRLRRPATRH